MAIEGAPDVRASKVASDSKTAVDQRRHLAWLLAATYHRWKPPAPLRQPSLHIPTVTEAVPLSLTRYLETPKAKEEDKAAVEARVVVLGWSQLSRFVLESCF